MNNILFRCSSLGAIMTEPKTNKAKDAGELSETAKTCVENKWLLDTFGYYEEIQTDDMLKGSLCEQDSMELAQFVLGGEFRTAYGANIQNDYITGTPDIVLKSDGIVEDIKTSANLRTFFNAELSKDYHAQLQGYMELTGMKKARLIYCLLPTPPEILDKEINRIGWQYGQNFDNPDYQRRVKQLQKNNDLIDLIEPKKRVKVFEIEYDADFVGKMYTQIEKARIYYLTLKL